MKPLILLLTFLSVPSFGQSLKETALKAAGAYRLTSVENLVNLEANDVDCPKTFEYKIAVVGDQIKSSGVILQYEECTLDMDDAGRMNSAAKVRERLKVRRDGGLQVVHRCTWITRTNRKLVGKMRVIEELNFSPDFQKLSLDERMKGMEAMYNNNKPAPADYFHASATCNYERVKE